MRQEEEEKHRPPDSPVKKKVQPKKKKHDVLATSQGNPDDETGERSGSKAVLKKKVGASDSGDMPTSSGDYSTA